MQAGAADLLGGRHPVRAEAVAVVVTTTATASARTGWPAAEEIGRTSLHPPYAFFATTGAVRAVQTAEILRHAAGQDDLPILTVGGLRSTVEDRWREAAPPAGGRADLEAIRGVDLALVDTETGLWARRCKRCSTRCRTAGGHWS